MPLSYKRTFMMFIIMPRSFIIDNKIYLFRDFDLRHDVNQNKYRISLSYKGIYVT